MVHVLDLLGCIANGPTAEDALEATPEAIRAFLRFMKRAGEGVDPEEPFTTSIAEHVTEGEWLGNGSPYLVFGPDLLPIYGDEIEAYFRRFQCLREEISSWAERQADEVLDSVPETGGRSARAILLHVLGPTGAYLATAVGGTTGFSRIHTLAERGEIPVAAALRQTAAMAAERALATTPEQREAITQRPKDVRTLRKAIRRTLEHDWEHLAELSRRPGGPKL
jgi:predicted RNase H-like HicB family nuclease/uncharacterized damage-inducible protein DinB